MAHEEKTTEITTIEKRNARPLWQTYVFGIALLLLVIGAGYYIYREYFKDTSETETPESIQEAFTPPVIIPPAPPTSTPPVAGPSPTPAPEGFSPRNPAPQPTQATVERYSNPTLGIELSMPANWTAQQQDSKVLFFDESGGAMLGFVEIFSNTGSEDLNSLTKILQGSPEITNVTNTTFAGVSALEFTEVNGSKGVATIVGNKIYYFHGSLLSKNIQTSFKFS